MDPVILPSRQWHICKFHYTTTCYATTHELTGRDPGSYPGRRHDAHVNGRSQQSYPHRRNESRNAPPSIMEIRIPRLVGRDLHRPHNPPPLPIVLRKRLLLHLA